MKKLYSLLIDYAIIIVTTFLVYFFVAAVSGILGTPELIEAKYITEKNLEQIEITIMEFLTLIILFFYYGKPFKPFIQTIGDKLMKIKIVPEDRDKIGFWYGFIRTMCLAPILALIGLIPIAGDPNCTVLDKICKTRTEYL